MLDPKSSPNSDQTENPPEKLRDILDQLVENTEGESVRIDDLMQAFDHRSYGPLLLVPALLAISPAGFIPGMSIVTGPVIFLIAAQMIFKQSGPWLPRKLRSFSVKRKTLVNAIEKMKPAAKWIDPVLHNRLEFMATWPLNLLLAATCMLLAVTMYPLAFVPFGVLAPGFAVTFFALGLTSRDGLLIIAGYGLTGLAIYLAIWAFL